MRSKPSHINRLILTCKHGSADLVTLDNLKHSSGIFLSQKSDSMNSTIVLLFCIEERLLHLRGRMGILITGETWQRCEKSCKILVFHLFHKIICLIEFSWRSLFHIQLHIALGLGVRHGEATAIVPLTRLRAHFWTFYIKDLVLRLTTMFETWIVLIDYKVLKTLLCIVAKGVKISTDQFSPKKH